MITSTLIFHLAAFAFTTSLCVSGFMRAFNITDVPVARSAHNAPTPTAAGVGIVAGMMAAAIALRLFYPEILSGPFLAALGGASLIIAALGLVDDLRALPPLVKGVVIALICALTPIITGLPQTLPFGMISFGFPGWAAYGGSVLWMFVIINLVNFMDGANGLMGGVMMIASAGLCALASVMAIYDVALIAGALSAAIAGFLVYNFRTKAVIFCGDVGALFIGFIFAASVLRLTAHPHGAQLLYAGPLLVLPILTDGLLTMLARARRREKLLIAHNTHLYQRLIQTGQGHLKTAMIYMLYAVICAVWVLLGAGTGLLTSAALFLAAILLASLIYVRARRKVSRD